MSQTQQTERFKLKIWRKEFGQKIPKNSEFYFIVCDMSLGDSYPQNYFCRFPKNFCINNEKIKFEKNLIKIFGFNRAKELAKKLLQDALQTEKDSEVRSEIKYRLSVMKPKPKKMAICQSC